MSELDLGRWIVVLLMGGLVGLDAASWPQFMISRPIVAGTLGGSLFGLPVAGFLVGAVLELFCFRYPPFGAARYPDTGPASLLAGAGFAAAGGGTLGAFLGVVAAGWALSWLGSLTVHWMRRLNGRLAGDPAVLAAARGRLERRHFGAIAVDGLRGAALAGAFLVPFLWLGRRGAALYSPGSTGGLASAVLMVALALTAGAGARSLASGRRRWPLLWLGGLAAGALLWVGRGAP